MNASTKRITIWSSRSRIKCKK